MQGTPAPPKQSATPNKHKLNLRKKTQETLRSWRKTKKKWKNTGVTGCWPTTSTRTTKRSNPCGPRGQQSLQESTQQLSLTWMTTSCCKVSESCIWMNEQSKIKLHHSSRLCANEKKWPFWKFTRKLNNLQSRESKLKNLTPLKIQLRKVKTLTAKMASWANGDPTNRHVRTKLVLSLPHAGISLKNRTQYPTFWE